MHHGSRLALTFVFLIGAGVRALGASDPALPAPETSRIADPASAPRDDWMFTLKPYLWAAGIDGDVEVRNLSSDIDVGFDDILDDLDFAAMLGFEAKSADGRSSVLVDLMYLDLEDERGNADVGLEAFMTEIDFAVQVGPAWLEILTGLRYWHFDSEVDPTGPLGSSASSDWVDPILGARATYTLPETRWTGQLRIDGGGFAVGSESTFQIWGDLRYAFSESFSANAGYRYLDLDYDGDNSDLDIALSGPLFGILWSF